MDYNPSEEERISHWGKYYSIDDVDGINRALLSRELFETTYRIHDHNNVNPDDPFPLATFKKTRRHDWAKKSLIKKLVRLGIPSKFGMDPFQMISTLNLGEIQLAIEIAEEEAKRENDAINNAMNEHAPRHDRNHIKLP